METLAGNLFGVAMHKLIISRKHNERVVKTVISVDKEGSPAVEMDLEDFKALLIQEIENAQEEFKKAVPPMWKVFTKATTNEKLDLAFEEIDLKGRIETVFEDAIRHMKENTIHLARYIK